jgi:hypothetical protein
MAMQEARKNKAGKIVNFRRMDSMDTGKDCDGNDDAHSDHKA